MRLLISCNCTSSDYFLKVVFKYILRFMRYSASDTNKHLHTPTDTHRQNTIIISPLPLTVGNKNPLSHVTLFGCLISIWQHARAAKILTIHCSSSAVYLYLTNCQSLWLRPHCGFVASQMEVRRGIMPWGVGFTYNNPSPHNWCFYSFWRRPCAPSLCLVHMLLMKASGAKKTWVLNYSIPVIPFKAQINSRQLVHQASMF